MAPRQRNPSSRAIEAADALRARKPLTPPPALSTPSPPLSPVATVKPRSKPSKATASSRKKGKGKAKVAPIQAVVDKVVEEEGEEDGGGDSAESNQDMADHDEADDNEEKKGIEEVEKDLTLYCICLGFDTGEQPMIQCEYCSNWFHFGCINLNDSEAARIEAYCCDICEEMGVGQTIRKSFCMFLGGCSSFMRRTLGSRSRFFFFYPKPKRPLQRHLLLGYEVQTATGAFVRNSLYCFLISVAALRLVNLRCSRLLSTFHPVPVKIASVGVNCPKRRRLLTVPSAVRTGFRSLPYVSSLSCHNQWIVLQKALIHRSFPPIVVSFDAHEMNWKFIPYPNGYLLFLYAKKDCGVGAMDVAWRRRTWLWQVLYHWSVQLMAEEAVLGAAERAAGKVSQLWWRAAAQLLTAQVNNFPGS
jgi:hypothetical protein